MKRTLRLLLAAHDRRRFRTFTSFQAAQAASDGYMDSRVVEVVSRATELHRHALLTGPRALSYDAVHRLFVVALAARDDPIVVVDFGGACGAAYFEAEAFLPGKVSRWHVVETSAMSAEGTEKFADGNLSFHSSLEAVPARPIDLLVASGALQFSPTPSSTFGRLIDLGAKRIFLARQPVSEGEALFVRQKTRLGDHGPGPRRPEDETVDIAATFAPRQEILDALKGEYQIEAQFPDSDRYPLRGAEVRDISLIARRK